MNEFFLLCESEIKVLKTKFHFSIALLYTPTSLPNPSPTNSTRWIYGARNLS